MKKITFFMLVATMAISNVALPVDTESREQKSRLSKAKKQLDESLDRFKRCLKGKCTRSEYPKLARDVGIAALALAALIGGGYWVKQVLAPKVKARWDDVRNQLGQHEQNAVDDRDGVFEFFYGPISMQYQDDSDTGWREIGGQDEFDEQFKKFNKEVKRNFVGFFSIQDLKALKKLPGWKEGDEIALDGKRAVVFSRESHYGEGAYIVLELIRKEKGKWEERLMRLNIKHLEED